MLKTALFWLAAACGISPGTPKALDLFALMWGGGFLLGHALGMTYARTTTLAFTAAGKR